MSSHAKRFTVGTVLVLVLVTAALFCTDHKVYKTLTVEAGTDVTAASFLKHEGEAGFAEGVSFDVHAVGEYPVKILVGSKTYSSTLIVEDTLDPVVTVQDVDAPYGGTILPEDFVTAASDGTTITYSFLEEPDMLRTGTQSVTILAEDGAGHTVSLSANLDVWPVYTVITAEAGSEIPDASVYSVTGEEVSYLDVSSVDMNTVGEYTVEVAMQTESYHVTLKVVDTTAPAVTFKERVTYGYGKNPDPCDFVDMDTIVDMSEVYITGVCEELPEDTYSLTSESTTEFVYTATVSDVYGNSVSGDVILIYEPDTEAPVITGYTDIYVYLGDSVSYKKTVSVTDNVDENVELQVDNSEVDLNTPGTYWIHYAATDVAGNTATASCYLNVAEKSVTEEEVYALADAVLAEILTDGMTVKEQLKAIYTWVRQNVGYISHSEKNDQLMAAYEGFTNHAGDCFVFAMTSKYLLERAGIPNIDIKKIYIEGASSHYWNLVDYGEGWYHFDTTPRKDGTVFFLWTDEELWEYSDSHKNSHKYDPTLYPEIN